MCSYKSCILFLFQYHIDIVLLHVVKCTCIEILYVDLYMINRYEVLYTIGENAINYRHARVKYINQRMRYTMHRGNPISKTITQRVG